MPQITRRLEMDYGHRVFGHEGKCKHLHGHRGVFEVTVSAPELDALGRVVDFSVIKDVIGGWIDRNWDHNLLLCWDDPLLVELAKTDTNGRNPYVFPDGNPTAENIAQELFNIAQDLLKPPLKVTHVRFYETPASWADVYATKETE